MNTSLTLTFKIKTFSRLPLLHELVPGKESHFPLLLQPSHSHSLNLCLRGFYFQIDDPQVMSQWMASMHRDRYMVVRDERDAYQQLQDQFSGQMDFLSKMNEDCNAEKDRLTQEVSKNQKLLDSLVNSIQQIFQTISVHFFFFSPSSPSPSHLI